MSITRKFLCAAAVLASVGLAHAETRGVEVDGKGPDGPERITARQAPASGRNHLVSTDGWSEFTVRNDAVYMQLTDFGMKQVTAPSGREEKDEGFLGNVIKAMALGGVKQLLDHSIALSLQDTRSALVRDGEIVIVACNGKEIFNHVKINDKVQKYPREQADAFVANLNGLRAKLPACRT